MGIYHTRSAPFNFLNCMGMRIMLNKRSGVGMEATHPKPALLPSLVLYLNEIQFLNLLAVSYYHASQSLNTFDFKAPDLKCLRH